MPPELVNGEARQAVAVLAARMEDCQKSSGLRWEQHDRAYACLAQQVSDVEKGIQQIKLTLASGGADVRKAELDRSSKVWVAVIGVVIVLINAAVQIAVAVVK